MEKVPTISWNDGSSSLVNFSTPFHHVRQISSSAINRKSHDSGDHDDKIRTDLTNSNISDVEIDKVKKEHIIPYFSMILHMYNVNI